MKKKSSFFASFLGYSVHAYTASGIIFSMLSVHSIFQNNYRMVYVWLLLSVIIDGTDGFLARKFNVKETAPQINGAKLDDLIDYINYTFLPLVMVWHAGWLPGPSLVWVIIPMFSSLFTFCHVGAKEADEGFFRGFPSYWNFGAFYIDVCFRHIHPWLSVVLILFFSVLSFLPLRFIYPSRTIYWPKVFIWGAILWTVWFVYMLYIYNSVPLWMAAASFSYPLFYLVASLFIDFYARRKQREAEAAATA